MHERLKIWCHVDIFLAELRYEHTNFSGSLSKISASDFVKSYSQMNNLIIYNEIANYFKFVEKKIWNGH